MSYLRGILQEELERLRKLHKKYDAMVSSLPRGSVSIKKRNQKDYLYLAYRVKSKVIFEYIGPAPSDKSKAIMEKVEKRRQYEARLKQVRNDMREIEKVIDGRKIQSPG